MTFERKCAVGFGAYGALVIALLATQTAPLFTVVLIFGTFVVSFLAGGVFLVVLANRRRGTAARGLRSLMVGLGVFYLVIGSLAISAFFIPSSRWPFGIIGFLFVAHSVAVSIARRVIRRRDGRPSARPDS